MFWSGNYITVREVNSLLKEENVTLTQILEADDILQECKADKPAIVQYLTNPEIIAELITLITEEPSKDLELQTQYQHASMACEVLTSHVSTLSDRLSSNFIQMNRLCDFINKEPPLNPLLASFFSKTVEMLLERSPKQDCYLYHIVCLRALDFFKSRQDFLPNLLRHISTSAIMDTFKYFMRLEHVFDKVILSWLEEHQFLEILIQIVCGSYGGSGACSPAAVGDRCPDDTDKSTEPLSRESDVERRQRDERIRVVAAANAANLLCEVILSGCADDGCATRGNVAATLAARLKSADGVALVLRGMFTSPAEFRRHALVHGCQVLLALLRDDPILGGGQPAGERSAVELVVAPHLPLLHQALLAEPDPSPHALYAIDSSVLAAGGAVGAARLQVATLMAQLAVSEVQEVAGTLVTLGTPATLLDMFFRFPGNNFLHAQVHALVKAALSNAPHRTLYVRHLLVECDLLVRLMDAFDEDETKRTQGGARSGYMGYALLMAAQVQRALEADGALVSLLESRPELMHRWDAFCTTRLRPALAQHDTPLGGYYPTENVYEYNESLAEGADHMQDVNGDDPGGAGGGTELGDSLAFDTSITAGSLQAVQRFLDLMGEPYDNAVANIIWDDYEQANGQSGCIEPDDEGVRHSLAQQVLGDGSPWEAPSEDTTSSCTEGWAQFGSDAFGDGESLALAVTAVPPERHFGFWDYTDSTGETPGRRGAGLENASNEELELANNLLNAMSIMTPEAIRNIMSTSTPAALTRVPDTDGAAPATADPNHVTVEKTLAIDEVPTTDSPSLEADVSEVANTTTSTCSIGRIDTGQADNADFANSTASADSEARTDLLPTSAEATDSLPPTELEVAMSDSDRSAALEPKESPGSDPVPIASPDRAESVPSVLAETSADCDGLKENASATTTPPGDR